MQRMSVASTFSEWDLSPLAQRARKWKIPAQVGQDSATQAAPSEEGRRAAAEGGTRVGDVQAEQRKAAHQANRRPPYTVPITSIASTGTELRDFSHEVS